MKLPVKKVVLFCFSCSIYLTLKKIKQPTKLKIQQQQQDKTTNQPKNPKLQCTNAYPPGKISTKGAKNHSPLG